MLPATSISNTLYMPSPTRHAMQAAPIWFLLITFANSLDPDQDRQNVGPDLDPKLFNTLIVFMKDVF